MEIDYVHLFWTIVGFILAFVTYLAYIAYQDGQYFTKKGVTYLGNATYRIAYMALNRISITDNIIENYSKLKENNQRFGVGKEFKTRNFFIMDLDLIKQIMVKDFDHFVDRRKFSSTKGDAMLGKMLVGSTGEKWKNLRAKMSPTFTTGKIKRMFETVDESAKKMVTYIEQDIGEEISKELDLQDAYSKFTMDVVASVAFGIDSKAFEQKGPSIFEQMGTEIQFKFNFLNIIKFLIMMMNAKLGDLLGFSIMAQEAQSFFSKVIKDAIKYRIESKEKRNDFLQLMLEVRDGRLKVDESELEDFEKEALIKDIQDVSSSSSSGKDDTSAKVVLDDDDIVAQCVLFILGGYDTTIALHLFIAYNLAVYPELQEKVYQEVEKILEKYGGELTYDSLSEMEYMDMFINETLRIYPPGIVVERTCTKDFKIPNSEITIPKGSLVAIPVYGLHRDEDYFPDPQKFDPERFAPENKMKIPQYAFLPFGHGPRNCIGMRLALAEVKLALAHLVHNFILEPSEKTLIPMEYASTGALKPFGGMCLKLQCRK